MEEPHYVVLVGDVGTGKSTLAEKISGVSGRSSDGKESFTTESKLFRSGEGRMIVADPPGSNAMRDKLEHESFSIRKTGVKRAEQAGGSNAPIRQAGCGARIKWSRMRLVRVPAEFQEGTINTNDVSVIPTAARGVAQNIGRRIQKITQDMSFGC